ncbi:MAG: response regulator transcription factor [Chloroflexi bacterium]|nr:response regulator transcription factor [Chloroflexota bacterium]
MLVNKDAREIWAGPLYHLFLLVNHGGAPSALADAVDRAGMSCQVGIELEQLDESGSVPPDAVLLDMSSLDQPDARRMIEQCHDRRLPVLAAVPREAISDYDPTLNPDEMVVCPVYDGELTARVEQAMFRVSGPAGPKLLRVGDLSIDQERYEVTVAGRRVALTYKEFQLLVLLASNPGRVYTREALLSQIWGYDYLGGTRTVDVHIRRLRSKVESPGRSFVETIWNVGYRFRAPA